MSYDPKRCDTLLIPSGPTGDHLFAVVTHRCPNGQHLLLNVSSIHEGVFHDNTCVLAIGDHPFITKPSYVVYRSAQIQHADKLTRMVKAWYYKVHEPADEALVDQILSGVVSSPFTPRYVKQYLGI